MIKKTPRPKGRDAIKSWNRMKIIEATIDVISEYGITGTTIGRVVECADVSRGLINVHFKSKDALLLEALKFMSLQYNKNRRTALKKAGTSPAEKMEAMIRADFSPKVLNAKTVSIWLAFRSQIRSHPEYLPQVDTRDTMLREELLPFVQQINKEGGYDTHPHVIVQGLVAMIEGMWMDFYIHPKNFDRKNAINTCLIFFSAIFPNHFHPPLNFTEA